MDTIDFEGSHTVTDLDAFAARFPGDPYLVYKGHGFHPFHISFTDGPSNVPCFRIHPMPLERWREGKIIWRHKDGRPFKNEDERDKAALAHAEVLPRPRKSTKRGMRAR